jgi:hypothetical protein
MKVGRNGLCPCGSGKMKQRLLDNIGADHLLTKDQRSWGIRRALWVAILRYLCFQLDIFLLQLIVLRSFAPGPEGFC